MVEASKLTTSQRVTYSLWLYESLPPAWTVPLPPVAALQQPGKPWRDSASPGLGRNTVSYAP